MKFRLLLAASLFLTSLYGLGDIPGVAMAQEGTTAPQPSFGESLSKMMPVILASFFIFYFMIVRPQNQKMQAQKKLLEGLGKGDQVKTTGGIYGKVAQIDNGIVFLEVAPQVRIRIDAAQIGGKVEDKKAEDVK